jgi:hypothetical protein
MVSIFPTLVFQQISIRASLTEEEIETDSGKLDLCLPAEAASGLFPNITVLLRGLRFLRDS